VCGRVEATGVGNGLLVYGVYINYIKKEKGQGMVERVETSEIVAHQPAHRERVQKFRVWGSGYLGVRVWDSGFRI